MRNSGRSNRGGVKLFLVWRKYHYLIPEVSDMTVVIVRGTPVVRKLPLPNSRRPRNCITKECIWYRHATILNLEDGIIT